MGITFVFFYYELVSVKTMQNLNFDQKQVTI